MRVVRRTARALVGLTMLAIVGTGVWVWQSGWSAYIVHTGSMSPHLKPGALVVDRPPARSYHPGEIITFRHSARTTDVVTHRITDIETNGLIHTKGDGNTSPDSWDIRPNQVRGRAAFSIPDAGYVLEYFKQPAGVASVITVSLALVLLYGLCFPPALGHSAEPRIQTIGLAPTS